MVKKNFLKVIILILLIILLMNSNVFTQQAYPSYHCSNIYKIKQYRFSKKKYQEKLKNIWSIIDTNSIYLHGPVLTYNPYIHNYQNTYRFIRFFGNGIVFISSMYLSEPTETQFNDLCYGDLYMYGVENKFIIFEYPGHVLEGPVWHYLFLTLSITQDTLFYIKTINGRLNLGQSKRVVYCEKNNGCIFGIKKKVPLYNYKWWEYSDPKDLRIPWKEREARKQKRKQKKK